MKYLTPIFTETFLQDYIKNFNLRSVTNINEKMLLVKQWIEELNSGKLLTLKEEEVKSRFVTSFFGDILGYNYGNSYRWSLREEKKSTIDGTKPDAALGYFFQKETKDIVKAIIEIKDANTTLGNPQKRSNKNSPIEQAFGYVSKSGGECEWVIVSNLKEIRFYYSRDQSKFQKYLLKDLEDENIFKELLFLFHKDRLIKEGEKSLTDLLREKSLLANNKAINNLHIVDKLFNCLKRFDGLGFVDPNYLSSIKPFNILDEHVWHYNNGLLFTINPDFYDLISQITIENCEISFTDDLLLSLKQYNVEDAENKIKWSFEFLNRCNIYYIRAVKKYEDIVKKNKLKQSLGFSVHHIFSTNENEDCTINIWVMEASSCHCVSCTFGNLDFKSLIKYQEKNDEILSLENIYSNYLLATDNFKTAYKNYKELESEHKGQNGNPITYFLTKYNIKLLHNLIRSFTRDNKVILNNIRSIELDRIIYDEIEFSVDREVKDYLIRIKEDTLILKTQDKVDDIVFQIEKLYKLYQNGGSQEFGPNLYDQLINKYYLLYLDVNRNFLIYDCYSRYKAIAEKVFSGLILSYCIPQWGIKKFNSFILTQAILHISPKSLQEILKKVEVIDVKESTIPKLIYNLTNLLNSVIEKGFFNQEQLNQQMDLQLKNYRFRDSFTNIFANIFTVLSKLELKKEDFLAPHIQLLIDFINIEEFLAHHDLKELGKFILSRGHLFNEKHLEAILSICIKGLKFGYCKYDSLLSLTIEAIEKFYPTFRFANQKLTQLGLLNSASDNNRYSSYFEFLDLSRICDKACEKILFQNFTERLKEDFTFDFYTDLIISTSYPIRRSTDFQQYIRLANLSKGKGAYSYGKMELTDLVFINFIIVIYEREIDLTEKEISEFSDLNPFEQWLLSPNTFDYSNFNAIWLTEINRPRYFFRFKQIPEIRTALEQDLQINFNPMLAEIKYKYFKN